MYEKETEGITRKIQGWLNLANSNDIGLLVSLGKDPEKIPSNIKRFKTKPHRKHLYEIAVVYVFVAKYREGKGFSWNRYLNRKGDEQTEPNKCFQWAVKTLNHQLQLEKPMTYSSLDEVFHKKFTKKQREEIEKKVKNALIERNLLHTKFR